MVSGNGINEQSCKKILEKGWHSAIDIHKYEEQLTRLLSEAFGGSVFVIFVDTGSETAVANFPARDLRKYELSRITC